MRLIPLCPGCELPVTALHNQGSFFASLTKSVGVLPMQIERVCIGMDFLFKPPVQVTWPYSNANGVHSDKKGCGADGVGIITVTHVVANHHYRGSACRIRDCGIKRL